MKHIFIRKSMIFIIIASLLLCSLSALAGTSSATIQQFTLSTVNTYNLQPYSIIDLQTDENGTHMYRAWYSFNVYSDLVYSSPNSNHYLYGTCNVYFKWSISANFTYTVRQIDSYMNDTDTFDHTYFEMPRSNTYDTALQRRIFMAFDNYLLTDSYCAGPHFTINMCLDYPSSISSSNQGAITVTMTLSDIAGTLQAYTAPYASGGLERIIMEAINTALTAKQYDVALSLIVGYSYDTKTNTDTIISQLATTNQNLAGLLSYMQNSQNSDLDTIISKIQELIDMGRQDTQAQNDLNAAASQMEGAAAAMNVTKPNMNSVIPQTLADADTVAAQGTIFSWLNNNYIIAILSAMMTIALIGFVLYGKSG